MVNGPVHVVGADGNVTVGAPGVGLLHALHIGADEVGGVARLVLHIKEGGNGLGHLFGLLGAAAVDARMVKVKAQHGLHRLLAHGGDPVPLPGFYHVALAHPGAAHGDDLVIAQVVVDVLGVDPAGAHPLGGLQRRADVLQHPHAAVGLGGEELQRLATLVHGLLHLAGGGGARHHDAAFVNDVLGDLGIVAGSHDELGAGGHGPVGLVDGEHRAGAQQHLGDLLGDGADALLSAGGAEGDLGGGKAARHQRLAQGHGFLHAVEGDDGDDADVGDLLNNWIQCTHPFFSPDIVKFACSAGTSVSYYIRFYQSVKGISGGDGIKF